MAAMAKTLLRRARKSWHLLRLRLRPMAETPRRLVVEKAKWLNDATSPVMLMIDDLTNAWHGAADRQGWDDGGDWGGGSRRPGSALLLLEERLMRDFPAAKVTFFTVAGPISAYTHHQPFRFAAPLDADEQSRQFFRSLAEDPRYELAYHGFNHGTSGVQTKDFVQEWQGFTSAQAAIDQTRKGLDVFVRAVGTIPSGGKYGGWDYNQFAEETLNECGFLWWCRDWTPRDTTGRVADDYYEPQFFGRNLVVALPSTVHGQFWDRRQIDVLLARRQVISIAEHIAPVRPDGRVQTPNIVDDMDELRRLYAYLSNKPVWYATGSEIASYVIARERTLIHDITGDGFSLRYDGRLDRPRLTLRIDAAAAGARPSSQIDIVAPDGSLVDRSACRFDRDDARHIVTVPAMSGRYTVRARTEEVSDAA